MHLNQAGRRNLGRLELRERIAFRQRRAQPRGIHLSRHQIALQVSELRAGHGWIELDEDVAGFHALTVSDMDRPHDAGLERLDRLRSAAWDDLAGRHRDDIDRADAGPGHGDAEYGDDGENDGVAGRRSGRFDDLERSWQKRQLVLSTLDAPSGKGQTIFSGPHANLPGGDRGSHNGRRS